jgi:hypothetical protein
VPSDEQSTKTGVVVRVRVWLADRPGALGSVASRIGGVGGDVIGIEILERGAGRAIDDLVVALPAETLIDLLVSEIQQVDGVDVEEVVPVTPDSVDPDIVALESVAELVDDDTHLDRVTLLDRLCAIVARGVNASWGAVVDVSDAGRDGDRNDVIVARFGTPPTNEWLAAFAHGSRSSAMVSAGRAGPDDTIAAPLVRSELVLLVGREGHAFRSRERRRCAAIARIVDRRLSSSP